MFGGNGFFLTINLVSLLFGHIKSDKIPEDACTYLDNQINYHIFKIPNQIDKALEVARKDLAFKVSKSHSQGISILSAVTLDVGSDFVMFNRTLSNLYGTDPSGLPSLHGHG